VWCRRGIGWYCVFLLFVLVWDMCSLKDIVQGEGFSWGARAGMWVERGEVACSALGARRAQDARKVVGAAQVILQFVRLVPRNCPVWVLLLGLDTVGEVSACVGIRA
jgi:hypothetical protein